MKSFKNTSVWMAVLTFTAVVLAVILLSAQSENAKASGMMLDQSGFSMITSGAGGDEILIVVDKSTQRMISYHLNGNNTFDIVGAVDFSH